MNARALKTAALGASLLVLGSALAVATTVKQSVRGQMDAADEDSRTRGRFKFSAITRNDDLREALEVHAKRLDTTDENVEYDVWLIDSDDNAYDMGAMRLRSSGKARFKFRTSRDDLPSGVDELRDFGGGTIEVRDGDTVVLSGDIADFVDLDDTNGEGSGASARGKDKSRLRAVDSDSRAKGTLRARAQNPPGGAEERIHLIVKRLDRGRYTLVAIDANDGETEIGTFRTHSRLGIGILRLDTRLGNTIPGGGVLALSGLDVEVRDADGNAVLQGSFPEL